MRPLLTLLLGLAAVQAEAQPIRPPDTLISQFLFVTGDTVYLRCAEEVDPDDSIRAPFFGALIDAHPPIWRFRVERWFTVPRMGETLTLIRTRMPRRAASVDLQCDAAVWDPLELETGSAYAAVDLVHRRLFKRAATGQIVGDLVLDWFWRGRDLVVVLDTTARFGDGTVVDAARVKASLQRYFWYRRPETPFAWDRALAGVELYRQGRATEIVGLIPRARDTLQFNLLFPLYDLPAYLASPAASIVRWSVRRGAAPVVAGAGNYGRRLGDSLFGQAPHAGKLTLARPADSRIAVLTGAEIVDPAAIRFPVPQLVVLRPGGTGNPDLNAFLTNALDRDALAALGTNGNALFPLDLYPVELVDLSVESPRRLNLERAKSARELLGARTTLSVGAESGLDVIGRYLVTALTAWDINATFVGQEPRCDLRVEMWDFGTFVADAYAETVLRRLNFTPEDSLVNYLRTTRAVSDSADRAHAYRSLLVRIADSSPYVVLYQPLGVFQADTSRYELSRGPGGQIAGPIFRRRGVE